MTFFLKILNESRSRTVLKVDGYSGARYLFNWDAKLRAYTYHPKDQREVDDLFRTVGRSTSCIFAPVSLGESVPAVAPVKPEEKPPLDDKLVEGALLRGVIVTDDDTNETIARLSQAYDRGATDALQAKGSTKKRP